jgi:hypothetical protein
MKTNWKFFGAACVLAGSICNLLGAPLPAIIFGIVLAIVLKVRSERNSSQLI